MFTALARIYSGSAYRIGISHRTALVLYSGPEPSSTIEMSQYGGPHCFMCPRNWPLGTRLRLLNQPRLQHTVHTVCLAGTTPSRCARVEYSRIDSSFLSNPHGWLVPILKPLRLQGTCQYVEVANMVFLLLVVRGRRSQNGYSYASYSWRCNASEHVAVPPDYAKTHWRSKSPQRHSSSCKPEQSLLRAVCISGQSQHLWTLFQLSAYCRRSRPEFCQIAF
ncbi:hypothetical protein EV426DRAFT_332208 [Tirmania nivea]|nr:hypothetical protein EV426DRAFT_332208 [Tirmania nivea]